MVQTRNFTESTFDTAFNKTVGHTVSTPYGTVTISNDGRSVRFDLYADVRESIHHKALFSYYQTLTRKGINQLNVDHLDLPNLDRSLSLKRGRAVIDLVYLHKGILHEVELKTHREVGLDQTAKQLKELSSHCQNLIEVVPRRDMENALTILHMLNLDKKITVDTYEILDDENNDNE